MQQEQRLYFSAKELEENIGLRDEMVAWNKEFGKDGLDDMCEFLYIEQMNEKTLSLKRKHQLIQTSLKVRNESMAVNAEFSRVEHDPEEPLIYVALVHRVKKRGADYCVIFPDFPACVFGGLTLDKALESAREGLIFHIEGLLDAGEVLPKPSALEEIKLHVLHPHLKIAYREMALDEKREDEANEWSERLIEDCES